MQARSIAVMSCATVEFYLAFAKEKGCKDISFSDSDYWYVDLGGLPIVDGGEFDNEKLGLYGPWQIVQEGTIRFLIIG